MWCTPRDTPTSSGGMTRLTLALPQVEWSDSTVAKFADKFISITDTAMLGDSKDRANRVLYMAWSAVFVFWICLMTSHRASYEACTSPLTHWGFIRGLHYKHDMVKMTH